MLSFSVFCFKSLKGGEKKTSWMIGKKNGLIVEKGDLILALCKFRLVDRIELKAERKG
jgi:hypothetical protein